MNQISPEVKNPINIKIGDEVYHLAAQKLVQRALTAEELAKVREGVEKDIEGYIYGAMRRDVDRVITQFLKNRSRMVGDSTPRYEIHTCEYNHELDEYQTKHERSFATEQDAREYIALHPYKKAKIIKVEATTISETQPKVEDDEIPF